MINLVRFLLFIFIIVLSLSLKASEASNWLKQEVDKILIAYQDPNLPNENRFLLIDNLLSSKLRTFRTAFEKSYFEFWGADAVFNRWHEKQSVELNKVVEKNNK